MSDAHTPAVDDEDGVPDGRLGDQAVTDPTSDRPATQSPESRPVDTDTPLTNVFGNILLDFTWRWVYEHTSPTRDPVRFVIEPEVADPADPFYQFHIEELDLVEHPADQGRPVLRSASRGSRARALGAELVDLEPPGLLWVNGSPSVGLVDAQFDLQACGGSLPSCVRDLIGGMPDVGIVDFAVDPVEDTIDIVIDVDRQVSHYRGNDPHARPFRSHPDR